MTKQTNAMRMNIHCDMPHGRQQKHLQLTECIWCSFNEWSAVYFVLHWPKYLRYKECAEAFQELLQLVEPKFWQCSPGYLSSHLLYSISKYSIQLYASQLKLMQLTTSLYEQVNQYSFYMPLNFNLRTCLLGCMF